MCSSSTGTLEAHSTHLFEHIPVLRDEVVSLYASVPPGILVDATVGGGGHAAALLEAYPGLRLVGLDRDPVALEAAQLRLVSFGDRVTLIPSPFSALEEVITSAGLGPLSGVLLDLGVSSPQIDRPERGFSFRSDGPLDMRMDPTAGVTAADLVNGLPEDAVPAAVRRKGHPARRVFQALRIEVNDELGQLRTALPAALAHLAVGGVCAVISYHSGEDRLTKQTFAEAATGGCVCPPGLPCVCGAVARHQLVFRGARKPSPSEVAANPRAESARLRAIVRTDAG